MYSYFISSNIGYDYLQAILITCIPGTVFTIALSLIIGFSLTFLNTKYRGTGIILLLISGVLNYFMIPELYVLGWKVINFDALPFA